MDYINTILVDSVLTDTTPTSTVEPTTKIAKMMVNEDMYLIIDQEAQ